LGLRIARPPSRRTLAATLLDKKQTVKKHLTIFLFLTLFRLVAQTTDSIKRHAIFPDNHYGPFHRTIKDTAQKTVTTFGHYFSIGTGIEHEYGYGGLGLLAVLGNSKGYSSNGQVMLASYSLAYKSHLLTVTGGFNEFGMNNSYTSGYRTNYISCLIGESIRYKHLMVSLSVGIASTSNIIYDINLYKFGANNGVIYSTEDRNITIPVELKAFLLARNGVGIGIHLSENLNFPTKYSPFSACLSVVTGFWNKPKNKK